MLINCSLRDLEVFLTVAETLHYRRSAERLHMSQPTVSGVIRRMETELGTLLFERSTRAVKLTAAGQVFRERVSLLRQQADSAVQALKDVVELREGHVRVAALPSLAATAVPAAFARFSALYPGVRLELLDTLSGPAFDRVRAGQADVALTAANPAYADLEYQPLGEDHFVLLMPADHRLAATSAPIEWAQTAQLRHISMPRPTSVRQYAEEAMLRNGLRFLAHYEVEHLATINAMVAAGLGVAALPELAARVAQGAAVRTRPLVAPLLPRPLGLVTRRGHRLSPAAAAMVELLRVETLELISPPVSS